MVRKNTCFLAITGTVLGERSWLGISSRCSSGACTDFGVQVRTGNEKVEIKFDLGDNSPRARFYLAGYVAHDVDLLPNTKKCIFAPAMMNVCVVRSAEDASGSSSLYLTGELLPSPITRRITLLSSWKVDEDKRVGSLCHLCYSVPLDHGLAGRYSAVAVTLQEVCAANMNHDTAAKSPHM